ncbi:hypothetical protein CCP4SC76_1150007 [Gammaproteobacteria bacterium]
MALTYRSCICSNQRPDLKGIKTPYGGSVSTRDGSNQRPDLKGIKTSFMYSSWCCPCSNQRPDLKGIKTPTQTQDPQTSIVLIRDPI